MTKDTPPQMPPYSIDPFLPVGMSAPIPEVVDPEVAEPEAAEPEAAEPPPVPVLGMPITLKPAKHYASVSGVKELWQLTENNLANSGLIWTEVFMMLTLRYQNTSKPPAFMPMASFSAMTASANAWNARNVIWEKSLSNQVIDNDDAYLNEAIHAMHYASVQINEAQISFKRAKKKINELE